MKSFDSDQTTVPVRSLYISKMFQMPLEYMDKRYQEVQNGQEANRDSRRYVLYSFHDYQIANVLHWLDPSYDVYNVIDTPYASSIFVELYFDPKCDASEMKSNPNCFTVQVKYNGEPLLFDTCVN